MLNLTGLSVRSLPAPEKGQTAYFEGTLPGFGVRVSALGTRSFFLLIGRGANRRRIGLGRVGIVKLAEARAAAKRLTRGCRRRTA